MLNPLLTTFLTVADCGSFTSASKRLFISATAVMKQMDVLEAHLDLRLLERTPHGVRLTAAGEMIARDARFLQDYARRSVDERPGCDSRCGNHILRGDLAAKPGQTVHGPVVPGQSGVPPATSSIWSLLRTTIRVSLPKLADWERSSTSLWGCATPARGWANAVSGAGYL